MTWWVMVGGALALLAAVVLLAWSAFASRPESDEFAGFDRDRR